MPSTQEHNLDSPTEARLTGAAGYFTVVAVVMFKGLLEVPSLRGLMLACTLSVVALVLWFARKAFEDVLVLTGGELQVLRRRRGAESLRATWPVEKVQEGALSCVQEADAAHTSRVVAEGRAAGGDVAAAVKVHLLLVDGTLLTVRCADRETGRQLLDQLGVPLREGEQLVVRRRTATGWTLAPRGALDSLVTILFFLGAVALTLATLLAANWITP